VTQQEHTSVEAIPVPARRFSHVHVDIVGPLPPSSKGHTYLLTMLDRATRWPEVVPLKDITAQSCADAFVDTWVARYGVPNTVTSDRGTQFSGSTWQCLCKALNMEHITTTAYHPQSNGLVERFHRQLKDALRARCEGKDWLEHLPWVLLGLRAAPKEEANVSSAEVTFGEPLVLPSQAQQPPTCSSAAPNIPSTVRTYADVAKTRPEFQHVYVRNGPSGGPLASKYSGPYKVLQQKDKILLIQFGTRQDWVSMDRIKPHMGLADLQPAKPPQRGRPSKKPPGDSRPV
jgi:hypothetical protein